VGTLLVDTNVLIEMTIAELRRVDKPVHLKMLKRADFVDDLARTSRLHEYLQTFDDIACSAGSLVEVDGFAVRNLQTGNREYHPSPHLRSFWEAFRRILANQSAVFRDSPRFQCLPFQLVPDSFAVWRYGPVDEHLLEVTRSSEGRTLLSADHGLIERARRLIGDRAVDLRSLR
jgi:hypothetical protein